MLNCRDVTSMASAYLDRALPWRTRAQVRLHLLMCRICRRYLKQLELTTAALRHLADTRTPLEAADPLRETFRTWKKTRGRSNTEST
jgi:predicted anti-sigma-YlaC factor YlaD